MRLKKIGIFAFICFFSFKCFCQDKTTDSLLKIASNHQNDTIGAKIYFKISSYYFNRGLVDSGFSNAKKGYAISRKVDYVKGFASAFSFFGQAFTYAGNKDSAVYYFSKAKDIYSSLKDSARIAGMLNNMGVVYYKHGDIPKTLSLYFMALKIKERLHDTLSCSNSYYNIGNLYSEASDTLNTLKYHQIALKLRTLVNDLSGIGMSNMAIGLYYQKSERLSQALPYLQKALTISEQINDEEAISIGAYNLASVYYKQDKIDECLPLFNRSLEISKKNNNYEGIATCLEILGKISLEKNNIPSGVKLLKEAYSYARIIDNKQLVSDISDNLSSALEKSGDFKSALLYRKIWITIKDSLFNQENTRKLTSEALKFEHEKERIVREKEQEKKEAEARSEAFKKDLILGASILFLLVVSGFSFIILQRLKENKKQKNIIEQQRNEMIDSINYAKRIQFALLAHTDLLKENLPQHFVFFKPKDIVSGDFYWATRTENFFYLAVCDSTGHGVPGAFMSLLNISFLNEAINEKNISAPNEVLDHVRRRLLENMDGGHDGMDAVLIKMPIAQPVKIIEYAAANNAPILIRDNKIIELPKDKMPVGKGESNASFKLQTIELKAGDNFYLYTDGFADQFGGDKGKKFKYKQLDELLLSINNASLNDQEETLKTRFDDWKGKLEQVDDVCILGLRF